MPSGADGEATNIKDGRWNYRHETILMEEQAARLFEASLFDVNEN